MGATEEPQIRPGSQGALKVDLFVIKFVADSFMVAKLRKKKRFIKVRCDNWFKQLVKYPQLLGKQVSSFSTWKTCHF